MTKLTHKTLYGRYNKLVDHFRSFLSQLLTEMYVRT
jgi:hypothetical protein